MEKSVVVLIADGSEEIEALTVVDLLRRAGLKVQVLATGKRVSGSTTLTLSHGVRVIADGNIEQYDSIPDAIVVPGGMPGATNIAESKEAISLIQSVAKNNGLVCAICAAPVVVLYKAGVLESHKYTCYPQMQKDWAAPVENNRVNKAVVKDGNLITGIGPGASIDFALQIISTLCGSETSRGIAAHACC